MATRSNSFKTKTKVVVAALAVFMVMLIIALIINLVRLSAVNDRRDALASENARLEQLIDESKSMLDYCNSNEFIEAYAREFLDMVYRGETVIQIKK